MSNPSELLQRAIGFHQAGDLARAESLYRQALAAEPRHADGWHLLGLLVHQQGKHDDAVDYIQRAIALHGREALYYHHLGGVYRATGHRLQSVAAFQRAIELRPDYAETYNNLAVVLLDLGRYLEAEGHCRRALELQPDYADACNNLGVALQKQGNFAAATEAFQRAVALRPDYLQAHCSLGAVLMELKRPDQAAAHFERAVQLAPRDPERRYQLGVACHTAGRLGDAAQAYGAALALQPDLAAAHFSLAAVFEDEGRLTEACASYERAIKHRPHHASSHNNLGNVHKHLHQLDRAVACYRQALEINPEHFNALVNLSSALHEQGKQAESLAGYARARAVRDTPALRVRSQLSSPLILSSPAEAAAEAGRLERNLAELDAADLVLEDPAIDVGMTPFFWAYLGCDVRPLLEKLAAFYRRAAPSLNYVAPHCQRPPVSASGRPIRVGFLSRYFYEHPVGMHYSRLLASLPRERYQVVLIRQPGRTDVTAKEIERSAHEVISLSQRLTDVQQSIARAQLDVLLYAEIGMDPLTYYLAYSRLAPVQCVLPGHPITSGIDTLDYFLSSVENETDEGDGHYTERLHRFLSLPTTFEPPAPLERRSREYFDLPTETPLYVCAQTLTKIHPDFDGLVAELLDADPQGRVVFFVGNQPHWTVALRDRLTARLGSAIDRVIFLPRQNLSDFRALLALADAVLDTVHFNGGTTTLEALAVGTPIVTLPSPYMRGRQTLSCYRKLGAFDCVARDGHDYVQIALRLAHDRPWRAKIAAAIQDGRTRIFEGDRLVGELEAFLERVVP